MRILVVVLTTILLSPFCAEAGDEPVTQVRKTELVRKSELARTPLSAGSLKIIVSGLNEKVKFGDVLGQGSGRVTIEIENTSSGFVTFDPHRFSFVNRDNMQTDVLDLRHSSNEYVPASSIRMAPGARVKETYRLRGEVRFPARLFYDEKPLAVITE